MARYADPQRCPDCRNPIAPGVGVCPSCGLPLHGPLAVELFATLSAADDLIIRMRRAAPAPQVMTTCSALTLVAPRLVTAAATAARVSSKPALLI